MTIGGISIKGSIHAKNQDSFICEQADGAYLVAVSDGLGSKALSEEGSAALTFAARAVFIGREGIVRDAADLKQFVAEVHARRLASLAFQNFPVEDCCCTCLIFLLTPVQIFAARLGDGFIGILADEKFSCLFDTKENRFFNETDCLTEEFHVDDWQFLELPYDTFGGAIVCTDGVSFGENKAEKFTRDFTAENVARSRQAILADAECMLTNWKSHDDKTLAFVLPDARR